MDKYTISYSKAQVPIRTKHDGILVPGAGDISKLPEENKNFVLNLIDMALRDFKVKKAHAS